MQWNLPRNKIFRFDVVYVSSDETSDDMLNCIFEANKKWKWVEFEGKFRTDLKIEHKICALKEAARLEISPSSRTGIPSLIIFGPEGDIVSKDGVDDIEKLGKAAFEEWNRK
mmetsp:Transcript_3698/g.5685  ORF Transcript_3698/g.5685 Transcript_3698/m.5685 type:complete len:112 (-) Transcript_3698:13-348(-)